MPEWKLLAYKAPKSDSESQRQYTSFKFVTFYGTKQFFIPNSVDPKNGYELDDPANPHW